MNGFDRWLRENPEKGAPTMIAGFFIGLAILSCAGLILLR